MDATTTTPFRQFGCLECSNRWGSTSAPVNAKCPKGCDGIVAEIVDVSVTVVEDVPDTAPVKAYRVKGTTDDVTECELCGRVELKGTVVMEALDADGNVDDMTYFGTQCAAKAAGWTQTEVKRRARTADREAREAEMEARREADRQERAEFEAWMRENYGTDDTRAIGRRLGVRTAEVLDVYLGRLQVA